MRQEIDIQITPDGEVKLTVRGVAGAECLELTQALEAELGVTHSTIQIECHECEAISH